MGLLQGPVAAPELHIELDRALALPLHEQLERGLREAIRSGRLVAGTKLPSTRGLAAEVGISRGVVSAAYGQLAAEGYLHTRQGAPVRVARAVRTPQGRVVAGSLRSTFAYDLSPGTPDLAAFPRDRWLRSARVALRESPIEVVGYGDPRGAPMLREALAGYLGRVRGAAADSEQILICTGFRQGLSLTLRWLRDRGVARVALEDPGWHQHRLIIEQSGHDVLPIPVDAEGLRVDELAASGASVVIVTPAHQFPTGAVLSRRRRAELIDWAEDNESLIIEDDFDAELRYDRVAVGALQGLAPERVLHIGSASKRLSPALRLAWMLLPSWLAWPLISAKTIEDAGSEVTGQLAMADFIVRGELDRHVRRMRSRYQRRRDALLAALETWLPDWHAGSSAAGLFELVKLPDSVDEAALLHAAARRGLGIEGLSLHRYRGGDPGVLLGYANVSESSIPRAVRLLAAAFDESRAGSAC